MKRSELTPLWNAASSNLSSTSSIVRASRLKQVIKDRRLSFSPCSMVSKLDEERLCLCPPIKLLTNNLLNSSKELTELEGILLNHTRAGPLRVVGKALHIISSRTPWRCIVVLKVAMWSKGSCVPSYESKEGVLNFGGRGWPLMSAVKGESILHWICSSHIFSHLIHNPSHLVHLLFQMQYPTRSGTPWLTLRFSVSGFFLTLGMPFGIFVALLSPGVKLSGQFLILTG